MANFVGKENLFGQMEGNMLEDLKLIRWMVMVNFFGQMENILKVDLKMILNMVKECID